MTTASRAISMVAIAAVAIVAGIRAVPVAPPVAVAADRSATAKADLAAIVDAGNQFAFDLYAELRTQSDGNLFFAPQNITATLAMAYVGARGDTAAQMAEVLHFNLPPDRLHSAQAALIAHLQSLGKDGSVKLNAANRLWGQAGHPFLDAYLDILRDRYDAPLEQVDFANPAAARQTINQWIESATAGKIKDLIPAGVLNPLTRLVLTGAVYFQGDWQHGFDPDDTRPEDFLLASGDKLENVPLMFQHGSFRFGQSKLAGGQGLKLLELPYQGKKLSMVVLLPAAVDGLPALEKELSAEALTRWLDAAHVADVRIWLPKFKLSEEFKLNGVLAALGMKAAFTSSADFSGIDGSRDLLLSAVLHKAFVDVHEKGTEAAAATAGVIALKSAPAAPPTFRADHPFVVVIRDTTTGAILFLGRVAKPQ